MTDTQKTPSGGKLENIKNIQSLLPRIERLTLEAREARARLDVTVATLRSNKIELANQKEELIRREQKAKEFEGLIRQREDERRAAEQIIDEKAKELAAKKLQKEEAKAAQNIKEETRFEAKPTAPYPGSGSAAGSAPQGAPYAGGTQRPSMNNFTPRPQSSYPPRQPFAPREQRPFGTGKFVPTTSRTWTPNQAQTGGGRTMGYGPRPQGSGFTPGGRDGRGGFAPRPQGTPGSRPFGPRPQGAGGPRPGGVLPKPTERFVPKTNTFEGNKRKTKQHNEENRSTMDRRSLLRRGIIEEQEIEERMLTRIFKSKKAKENSSRGEARKVSTDIVINAPTLTVKTLSEKIGKTASEIIKQLMVLGSMCTINSSIDFETAELVSSEFGITLILQADKTAEEQMKDLHKKGREDEKGLESRPPVVTVMGHVDHGKTSLLDAIRRTNVVSRESGGITQHIGAYQVTASGKRITFIDTPGHAAFDKMRARGAKITDIAILIVAADDGVMPQTIEAIQHIQQQNIPMIVAINKMDKKEANPDRVKQQLSEHNVIGEEWGGSAIMVPISATSGAGLDKLLEMVLLVSDMNGYTANPNKEAQGTIIDARLDKQKGPLVTVLVQSGTLKIGNTLLAGTTYGKVRGMTDENGRAVKKATPSMPVSILGFNEVPKAGDAVYVVDEKLTKQVVDERKYKQKVASQDINRGSADIDAFAKMQEADKTQLNVIIKGDVSGSVEAIIQSVNNIISDEVTVNVISSGVGSVSDNDVALAEMSNALLIAFHSKITPSARAAADKAKIKVYNFKIIYEIFDFITEQMVRLFRPKFTEKYFGRAEVRALFKSSQIGIIAGCMVTDGKILRSTEMKLIRGGEEKGKFKLGSLKIKTNDQKEVAQGFECGIKLDDCTDIQVGDVLECLGQEQLPIIFNGKKYEFSK